MASLIANIRLKYDTLANWTREDVEGKGAFLVLQRGEVGFCEVPSNIEGVLPTILFKVGDGNSTFGELNWVSALASDVHPWAKAENKPEYSAAEINGLSEYITEAIKDTNTEYRFNKVNDYEYEFQSKEIGGTEWNVDFTLTIPKYDDTPIKTQIQDLSDLVGDTAVSVQISQAVGELEGKLAAIAKTGSVADLVQNEGDILILDCNVAIE